MKANLKAIDLFAGCGGLTLGLKQAGFSVIGAIELDPLAVETYRANHTGVRVWEGDIQKLPASRVMEALRLKRGDLDLLAGCPPCQGFSSLTTLNGCRSSDNPMNDLLFEFVRFVRVLRPKAIMLENVPGLKNDPRLRELTDKLQDLGYRLKFEVLDAADYGVPQRRRRFILIGGRSALRFAKPTRRQISVRDVLKKIGKRALRDELHTLPENRSDKVRELIRLIPTNGGSRTALGPSRQLNCHKKCDGFSDVYGRMSWDSVAPTITGGCCNPSKGRFLHPSKNRCITLREAALLQTFPATYDFSLRRGKFAVAQMIGNAVPPEFARRHANAIRQVLRTGTRDGR
jgi:DNA (cytosine-5)-methyltransferase 1